MPCWLQRFMVFIIGSGAMAAAFVLPTENKERQPIRREDVAAALRAGLAGTKLSSLDVTDDGIEFPASLTANSKNPDLRLVEIMTDAERGTLQAKLRCRSAKVCLPFFVTVHLSTPPTRAERIKIAGTQVRIVENRPPLLKTGSSATLILESSGARVWVPVICLEPGGRGQRIRVRSIDHKQVFRAEIVSQNLLRGSF